MTPDLAKRLARSYPAITSTTGVAHVAGVAAVARYAPEPQQLRRQRPLRPKIDKRERENGEAVAAALDAVADAIEERRAIVAACCPAPYVDAFSRLNHQKPVAVSAEEWVRAVDNAGMFLDGWGSTAVYLQIPAGDLLDVPHDGLAGGLIWHLRGARVEALGPDNARLSDGREVVRSEFPRTTRVRT